MTPHSDNTLTGQGRSMMQRLVFWGLLLLAMALVLFIRLQHLDLPVAEELGEQAVQQQLRLRIAQQVARQFPRPQWQQQIDLQTRQWIAEHQEQFDAARAKISRRIKAELSYAGDDGLEYPHLGGADGYLWLRNARNYLRTGTVCDAIVDGACRDTYGLAPVGFTMLYDRSLHTAALVGLHRLITSFKPQYPLPATALVLPVIISVLGVLPAGALGRYVAGNIAALVAAVYMALDPMLIIRSISGDNDIWNVVLPLYLVWAVAAALNATRRRWKVLYSVGAGACVGLQAAIWSGWWFAYAIVLAGLLGTIVLHGLGWGIRQRSYRIWQAASVRQAVLVTALFYVMAGFSTTLAGAQESYLAIPGKITHTVSQFLFQKQPGQTPANPASEPEYWPDVFQTVKELRKPDLNSMIGFLGGRYFFLGGLLGLVLLLLPYRGWRWYHAAALLGSALVFGYVLLRGQTLDRAAVLGLLALPLVCATLLRLGDRTAYQANSLGICLIIVAWFVSGLYVAYDGNRFLLFLGPPFGLALATGIGRLYTWADLPIQRLPYRYATALSVLLFVLLALLLIPQVQRGYALTRSYTPAMTDAWWNTLTNVRQTTPPDTVVNTWWDYGYWVKYVAERRVSSDGGLLRTHVHHWMARALIAPSERESIGILRMLNCGSDATPLPEGKYGAYGKVRATGRSPGSAYDTVATLVTLDESAARSYLTSRGFTDAEGDDILRSTHCLPPPAYLILDNEQVQSAHAWGHLGIWDPRKAYMVQRTRTLSGPAALTDLIERFGHTAEQAKTLYTQVTQLAPHQLDQFVAPQQAYSVPAWLLCRRGAERSDMTCHTGQRLTPDTPHAWVFVYDPSAPHTARFRASTGAAEAATPAVVVFASAGGMERVVFPQATLPTVGVLIDIPQHRILLGTPALIQSTFTHLVYLDGRYATRFEKFDERVTYAGKRVLTWKIDWQER